MSSRPKLIVSTTDYILVVAAVVMLGVEIAAIFGGVDFITNSFVRLSIFQLWIPAVLGILAGHFFPFTYKYKVKDSTFLTYMFLGVGGYIIWYIFAPEQHVITVIDLAAEYLYTIFLSGYLLGALFFGRSKHMLEN